MSQSEDKEKIANIPNKMFTGTECTNELDAMINNMKNPIQKSKEPALDAQNIKMMTSSECFSAFNLSDPPIKIESKNNVIPKEKTSNVPDKKFTGSEYANQLDDMINKMQKPADQQTEMPISSTKSDNIKLMTSSDFNAAFGFNDTPVKEKKETLVEEKKETEEKEISDTRGEKDKTRRLSKGKSRERINENTIDKSERRKSGNASQDHINNEKKERRKSSGRASQERLNFEKNEKRKSISENSDLL